MLEFHHTQKKLLSGKSRAVLSKTQQCGAIRASGPLLEARAVVVPGALGSGLRETRGGAL